MTPLSSSGAPSPLFASTRWSVILAAREGSGPSREAALSSLCSAYWRPLYAYVRRQGRSVEDAQDLTQGFFLHLLEKQSLRQVDPALGRFRSFLLASMRNFMAGDWRRHNAAKRGGITPIVSIGEMERGEELLTAESPDSRTPEQIYERNWALALLERSMGRLAAEFESSGKQRVFALLSPYLTGEHDGKPYAEVASQLAIGEVAARVAVHRMRGRFQDLLREEVARTLPHPEDPSAVMEELRYLLSAL
jgi:RNA polymerase sigma-70 factor (ECF subfamily)